MTWIIIAIAAVGLFGWFEWKAWNKPGVPGLTDHVGTHNAAMNHERPLTGGHDADGRH